MFGGKKADQPTEPMTHGWRDHDLKMLATTLKGDGPVLRTMITGFRQGISVDGDRFYARLRRLRADHEMYQQSALLFDEMPGDERLIPMVEQENDLIGTFLFDRVRVQGHFGIESNFEDLDQCEMGWANITSLDDVDGKGLVPLLQFGFTVSTADEQRILQDSFRGAVTSSSTYLNLCTNTVDDVNDWINRFRDDGYSPSLRVEKVYIGAAAGRGSFD